MNRRQMLATIASGSAALASAQSGRRRSVIFILSDDHRYDAMGFLKAQPWLETPQMDRLAREGAHFKNAFVTTALCSPSRASILTGVYAHRHRIVDNNTAIPAGTVFFPSHLQKAGYKTGFFGKWHMGAETDDSQPGFDQWVSFKGQGTYWPNPNGLNVNGKKAPQKGYITDELTDYALDWLNTLPREQPYFMYLSHKAVHGDFEPATRHKGHYKDAKFIYPATMAASGEMAQHRPMWVQNQRNSWHGVDYPYHTNLDIAEYYKRYAETLMGVDESIGRVLDALHKRGELDSTLVIYMGDNGFAFGEHGLIDKRTAYEESMRVPLLARCPDLFRGGQTIKEVVAGLDIMPTVLAAAGVGSPAGLNGKNWLPIAQGKSPEWRRELLYEYYWERNFPQTYLDMYPLNKITLPLVKDDDLDDIPPIGRQMAITNTRDHERVKKYKQWESAARCYLAAITFADAQVGRVLDALDAGPHAKNTNIVLWSDHGWHLGEKLHWRKFSLWERSTRNVLMMSAPGLTKPGSRCDRTVSLLDIYPTLTDMFGLPGGEGLEGRSLMPLLKNPSASRDHPVITTYLRGNHAVRDAHWRYIRYHDGTEELYDRDKDPNEWTNIAAQPSAQKTKQRLARHLPSTDAPDVPRDTPGPEGDAA